MNASHLKEREGNSFIIDLSPRKLVNGRLTTISSKLEKLIFWVLDIASSEQNEGLCVKTAFRLQNSVVLIGDNIKKLMYIERRAFIYC